MPVIAASQTNDKKFLPIIYDTKKVSGLYLYMDTLDDLLFSKEPR